jgi:hypothetical protein
MDSSRKFIVACKARLQAKYGKQFAKIEPLIKKLIAADKKRGLQTSLLFIDDATSAKALGLKAVKATTPRDCKTAIDALYQKHAPDYITLLGAQDVFPFQALENPTDDEDATVPSDLPYACETAYSTDISKFLGPTRVVGRLPDIPDSGDIGYLTKLVNTVISYKQLLHKDYSSFFAVSARVWQKSTKKSLMETFGQNKGLFLSPNAAPEMGYEAKQLSALAHFYNCHGSQDDPRFWGQKDANSPINKVAVDSANLTNRIAAGTVVAAECCYGAALFNPEDVTTDGTPSIASNYLAHGALGFLGSSTIAYGPADGQGQADLITQYFLINVLGGASTGRALLEARQQFLSKSGPNLDPVDLKTIAQFYLLGDASVAPVQDEVATPAVRTKSAKAGTASEKTLGNTVRNRRKNLLMKGLNLSESVAGARRVSSSDDAKTMAKKAGRSSASASAKAVGTARDLKAVLKETGFDYSDTSSLYDVDNPVLTQMAAGIAKAMLNEATRFRTFTRLRTEEVDVPNSEARTKKAPVINHNSVLVVKEDDDRILRWRVYVAR